MSDQAILALGHSHLAALRGGWKLLKAEGRPLPEVRFVFLNKPRFQPNFAGPGARRALSSRLTGALEALLAERRWKALLLAPLGNECLARFLVADDPPLALHDPSIPAPAGAVPVCIETLRCWLREIAARNAGLFLSALRERTDLPLFLLPPPPPIASERTIREGKGPLHAALATARLNPPKLRLAIWELYREVLAELARETMTTLLPPPAATRDRAGFLHPSCTRGDPTHANARYGACLWSEILRHLSGGHPEPASPPRMELST